MDSICLLGGESLSRFIDGELSPSEHLEVEAHVQACASCEHRLREFRLADGLLSRTESRARKAGRLAASLSVAAALLASLATNVILSPGKRPVPPAPLTLSDAPAEALSSFYAKVASAGGEPR